MIHFGSLALSAYNTSSIPQTLGKRMPRISNHIEEENKSKENRKKKTLVLSDRNPSPNPQISSKHLPIILSYIDEESKGGSI